MAAAWKMDIARMQQFCCIICGEPVAPDTRSWDHFIPQTHSGPANSGAYRIGLVYLAHQLCNNSRGHQPPGPKITQRAASVIAALEPKLREEAKTNIERSLKEHRRFGAILEELKAAIKRGENSDSPSTDSNRRSEERAYVCDEPRP